MKDDTDLPKCNGRKTIKKVLKKQTFYKCLIKFVVYVWTCLEIICCHDDRMASAIIHIDMAMKLDVDHPFID